MRNVRIMRMLVMFDLPTGNASERKSYARFGKFLLNDGYTMEQFSVYTRVVLSRDSAETHLSHLKENLPEAGSVTALMLTEKQYESRKVLVSTRKPVVSQDLGTQMTLVF